MNLSQRVSVSKILLLITSNNVIFNSIPRVKTMNYVVNFLDNFAKFIISMIFHILRHTEGFHHECFLTTTKKKCLGRD